MSAPASPSAALTASAAGVVAWLRTTFAGAGKSMEGMGAHAQASTETELHQHVQHALGRRAREAEQADLSRVPGRKDLKLGAQ